jgi:hypothetical protein
MSGISTVAERRDTVTIDEEALDLVIGDLEKEIPDLPNPNTNPVAFTCGGWYCV